jgi:hypothetical protein
MEFTIPTTLNYFIDNFRASFGSLSNDHLAIPFDEPEPNTKAILRPRSPTIVVNSSNATITYFADKDVNDLNNNKHYYRRLNNYALQIEVLTLDPQRIRVIVTEVYPPIAPVTKAICQEIQKRWPDRQSSGIESKQMETGKKEPEDPTDARIMKLINKDIKITDMQIAQKIGGSRQSINNRRRALEKAGYKVR